jgi:N-acyl-D-aspartate/D-glutamate deacylase
MGNCGVGFAPCRRGDESSLIGLMEGVEDLPANVLRAGLSWQWQSFPEYLDCLSTRKFDIDVAAQIPHAPLRLFVMGERGADGLAANDGEIAEMARLAAEAVECGAIGFSTSRALAHRSSAGRPIGSLRSSALELNHIASAIGRTGRGVLEAISDFEDVDHEFELLRGMAAASGRPLSISLLQKNEAPTRWRAILSLIENANRDGLSIRGQVYGRPIGLLLGFELSRNPFSLCPTYLEEVEGLDFPERLDRLRQPNIRRRLIAELNDPATKKIARLDRVFVMADPPEYEPHLDRSIAALAQSHGCHSSDVVYDALLAENGRAILYAPMSNFHDGTLEVVAEMMQSSYTVLGLGDGGAHCGLICDASLPTFMLTYWARDRLSGRIDLAKIVQALTSKTAMAVGLYDRGLIASGYRADINIIDFNRLRLRKPRLVHDLPAGGGRLDQEAEGYVATIVAGQVTRRSGVATDVLPGRLVRAGQQTSVANVQGSVR